MLFVPERRPKRRLPSAIRAERAQRAEQSNPRGEAVTQLDEPVETAIRQDSLCQ